MAEKFIEVGAIAVENQKIIAVLPKAKGNAPKNKMATEDIPSTLAARAKSDRTKTNRHEKWGADDKTPQRILDGMEKVPMVATSVERNVNYLLGNELKYILRTDWSKGSREGRRDVAVVEDFLAANNIETEFLEAQANDLAAFWNCFSQFISGSGKNRKIVQLTHLEAEFTRIARYVEAKQGDREFLYFAAEFAARKVKQSDYDNSDIVTTLPLFNPLSISAFMDFAASNLPTFAYQTRPRTSRSFYYATPPHLGLFRDDGWIDVSAEVPAIQRAMQKNQISLRYMILIGESYFMQRYQNWKTLDPKKREEAYEEIRKEIEEKLVGTKNSFSSITLICKDFNGEMRQNVKIVPIEDKAKHDTWVPSSEKSDAQIVQAYLHSPSQVGLSTDSNSLGGGAGSVKREDNNTKHDTMSQMRRKLLSPLQLVADYNRQFLSDWDVVFYNETNVHTTLSVNPKGIAPPPINPAL